MTAESIGYGIVGAGYLGKALARGLAALGGGKLFQFDSEVELNGR